MKRTKTLLLLMFYRICCFYSQSIPELHQKEIILSFQENKGQVGDQFSKSRPDVLFSGSTGDLNFYLRSNGISYQMYRVDKWKQIGTSPSRERLHKVPAQTNIYRLDIEWLNTNSNPTLLKENPLPDYNNYYTALCPNGVTGVMSYKNVCYKNLYQGIDLKWYEKNGTLKYDFVIAPGVDHKQIQMQIKGAENISVNKNGELIIKTPLGILTEKAPYVTQNGRVLKANWVIDGSTVSFYIQDVNLKQTLIIDPLIRFWGSYYGGKQYDGFYGSAVDASGNLYASGDTYSNNNIATTGAHQTVLGDLGSVIQGDAILVKFNPAGQRLWATYYGGEGEEYSNRCAVNLQGNFIAMVGTSTSSLSGSIATPGSHQAAYAGSVSIPLGYAYFRGDAFLAMFNASGVRQWATYYGGPQNEWGSGCAFDQNGNVYMTGSTTSTNPSTFATPGSHQPNSGGAYDGFLAKFNSSGTRLWGTFYGGSGWDYVHFCAVDADGNVCITGNTGSKNNISSTGAFQTALSGPNNNGDGLIAKFNPSGLRQWGTYYGDWGEDRALNCAFDKSGDIYVAGLTTPNGGAPTEGLATAGAHQTKFGGGVYDAYLLKLTASGSRSWCTYFGGKGDEVGNNCTTDPSGNIYLLGCTSSTNAVSTPCARQINYAGGGADAYMTKFNSNGTLLWGTYYGGSGAEYSCTGSVDLSGNIFLAGCTSSATGSVMVSPGSYQTVYGGEEADGYLAKFDGCIPNAANTSNIENLIICEGKSTVLSTSAPCSVTWYDVPVAGVPIGNNSVFITPDLTSNSTFYVTDASCGSSTIRTAITVTVKPYPTISIDVPELNLCSSTRVDLTASGASSYTWYPETAITCTNCPNPVVSPPETTEYCVTGTNDHLCFSTNCTTIEVNTSPQHSFSFPSAFTPNGDGNNDRFCLQGWDECNKEFLIRIFNRWGEKVFESGDPNFCWDGTYKGQLLSSEVFMYSVSASYHDGTKTDKTGNITLLR